MMLEVCYVFLLIVSDPQAPVLHRRLYQGDISTGPPVLDSRFLYFYSPLRRHLRSPQSVGEPSLSAKASTPRDLRIVV